MKRTLSPSLAALWDVHGLKVRLVWKNGKVLYETQSDPMADSLEADYYANAVIPVPIRDFKSKTHRFLTMLREMKTKREQEQSGGNADDTTKQQQ